MLPITNPCAARATQPSHAHAALATQTPIPPAANAATPPALAAPAQARRVALAPLQASHGAFWQLPHAVIGDINRLLEWPELDQFARTSSALGQTVRTNAHDPLLRDMYRAQYENRQAAYSIADPENARYRMQRANTPVIAAVQAQRAASRQRAANRDRWKTILEGAVQRTQKQLREGWQWSNLLWETASQLHLLGRTDEALRIARQADEEEPSPPQLVQALLCAGHASDVVALVSRSENQSSPDMPLTQAHLLLGDGAQAIELLLAAGDKAPRHLMAMAQYMVGDIEASARTLEALVSSYAQIPNTEPYARQRSEAAAKIALVYASRSDAVEAARWLGRAGEAPGHDLQPHRLAQSPFVPLEVRESPAWRYQLRLCNAAPDQLRQIRLDNTAPREPADT